MHSKGNYKQGGKKKKPSEWEKIIINETSDKGLISQIYKPLIPEKQTIQSKSGKKT